MAEILQYVNRKGFFHYIHPYTKIIFLALTLFLCIYTISIGFLAGLAVALLVLVTVSGLFRELAHQFKLILVLSLILLGITVIILPPVGDPIGYFIPMIVPFIGGSLPITLGSLDFGMVLTLRFVVLIWAFQLFLMSTQPRDIAMVMEKLRIPVEYILMFLIALRFIPTLQIEGKRIHEAQLARGFNPGTGLVGKLKSFAPIIIPLVSNALARATVLGLTIDMRGYRSGKRTYIHEYSLKIPDYLILCYFAGVLGIFVWLTLHKII
jgi:energy-coupling factor transport system permease protein